MGHPVLPDRQVIVVRNAARLFKLLHQCVERAEAALEMASDPAAGGAPAVAAADAPSPQTPHAQAPPTARAVSAPAPSAEATSPSLSASSSASASASTSCASLPPARPGSTGPGAGAATATPGTPEDEERLLTMQPILAAQRKNQALMRHYEAKKDGLTRAKRAELVRSCACAARRAVVGLTRARGACRARPLRQRTQFYRQMVTNMQVAQTQQEEVRSDFHPCSKFTHC